MRKRNDEKFLKVRMKFKFLQQLQMLVIVFAFCDSNKWMYKGVKMKNEWVVTKPLKIRSSAARMFKTPDTICMLASYKALRMSNNS